MWEEVGAGKDGGGDAKWSQVRRTSIEQTSPESEQIQSLALALMWPFYSERGELLLFLQGMGLAKYTGQELQKSQEKEPKGLKAFASVTCDSSFSLYAPIEG